MKVIDHSKLNTVNGIAAENTVTMLDIFLE
jgi:hypothetical protein